MNDENMPDEYVAIRVKIVHVKKRFWGFKDTQLGAITLIPDTTKDAEKIFKRIQRMFRKHGVEIKTD